MSCRYLNKIVSLFLLAIGLCANVGHAEDVLFLTSTRPYALVRVGEGEDVLLPFRLWLTQEDLVSALEPGKRFLLDFAVEYDSILPSPLVSPPLGHSTSALTNGATSISVPFFDAVEFMSVRYPSIRLNISLNYDPASENPYTVVGDPAEFVLYNVNAYHPDFLIVNPATVVPDSEEDVFLYAIGDPTIPPGYENDLAVCKDGANLPEGEPLVLATPYGEDPGEHGKYWRLKGGLGTRSERNRLGSYELTSYFLEMLGIDKPLAFVTPRTHHLDTNGVHTITVYARPGEESDLLEEPLNFGVKKTALSGSIRWFKDGRLVNHGTPRLTIRTVDEVGLYTLHRYTRKKLCWFVQIKVQLSPCPRGQVTLDGENCADPHRTVCYNGGVLSHDYSPTCQCPPCFRGFYCEHLAPTQDPFAIKESRDFTCGQLPGGNEECEKFRFCLGGNYGCSCGCGWQGQSCDEPCSKGFYGADCSQKCNCLSSGCDRFTGQCESFECPPGYHGFNCQVPVTVDFGP